MPRFKDQAIYQRYPALFTTPKRPLKIGIREDLLADGWDAHRVRDALVAWTDNDTYAACLKPGAARFDLAGNPCGVVTAEQAALAATRAQARAEERAAKAERRRVYAEKMVEIMARAAAKRAARKARYDLRMKEKSALAKAAKKAAQESPKPAPVKAQVAVVVKKR